MKIDKLRELINKDDNLESDMWDIYCDHYLYDEHNDELHSEYDFYRYLQNHFCEDVKDKTLRKCFIIFNDDEIITFDDNTNEMGEMPRYEDFKKKKFTMEFLKIVDIERYNEILILEKI